MANVDIYLPIESNTEWIRALSIPHRDIQRFTVHPLKWLRFATFAVCGAKGHFSTTQGGGVVDENVSFDNIADRYFYNPDDIYHLVDYKAFNDTCTSSAVTPRSSSFRNNICTRDDRCVITNARRRKCDATHIVPRSKGNNYISYVIHDRYNLYERMTFFHDEDVDIDCIENGMLLRKDIHVMFGEAEIVFLKTPNFAMVPADVPRAEEGSIPDNRTTLQYMVESSTELDLVPPCDVRVDWSHDEVHPPPNILLDFMYGAAVVKHWKCDRLHDMLEKRFKADFSTLLAESPKRSAPEDDESEVEPDNPDWKPSGGKRWKRRKTFSSDASAGLLEAMDDMLLLSMLLKGTTPQLMAAEWERQHKEEESRSQERSREKVQQWLNLSATSLNNVEKD